MAQGVLYLDIDDEITSAAARIRTVEGRRVAVVLPYGSRVATSRINFRLLARDATSHEKRLSIVAADPATRALAASAGIPVFATVGEYESSVEEKREDLGDGRPGIGLAASATVATVAASVAAPASPSGDGVAPPGPTPARPARPLPAASPVDRGDTTLERTAPVPREPSGRVDQAGDPAGAPVVVPRAERDRGRGRRIGRTPVILGLAVLALVAIVGGVAAYLMLPSATIAVTPRAETIGPVSFTVEASTRATEPDPAAGIVPAQVIDLEVQATGTFEATGRRVEETSATGRVRFDNLDPTSPNRIAAGAVVSTEAGIRFRIDQAVTVPSARLQGLQIVPSSASVGITAVDAGPEGNVAPNSIVAVPRGEEPIFLKVTNPDATEGGVREEFPRVVQEDVDAAVAQLTTDLGTAFAERLEDPDLTTDGATVFPDTAALGDPVFGQDLEALVGQEVESFDLEATATGTVTAVDAAPVGVIAEERLNGSVEDGYVLVDGSSDITVDPAVVSGGRIRFPVTVTASQVRILDPSAIEAEIAGRPLEEARAILETYGTVDLQVWPDWVATIPTLEGRVSVTVDGPTMDAPDGDDASPAP
jgi:hypothetical protein